jgi:competence protein ComEC
VRDAILAPGPLPTGRSMRRAAVVAALVTGDQNVIERADWDVFRATGVAHLMSISGLHITMFAWVAAALVGWLWRRSAARWDPWPAGTSTAALIGGVLLATGYALFSGWGVPAQRTVLMLATVALLQIDRAALALVAGVAAGLRRGGGVGPVGAAAGRASGSALSRWACCLLPIRSCSRCPWASAGPICSMLREQWVVTLALTPLSCCCLARRRWWGCWPTCWPFPGSRWWSRRWPCWACWAAAVGGRRAGRCGRWRGAAVAGHLALGQLCRWPRPAVGGAAGTVLGGVLLALRWPWHLRLALGLPLLLPVLLWQPAAPGTGAVRAAGGRRRAGQRRHGAHRRHTLVYDAGPRYSLESDAGHRVLVPLLRALGERVDMLVLSHRDSDHTGGAARRAGHAAAGARCCRRSKAGHELQALRPVRCQAGQRWHVGRRRF